MHFDPRHDPILRHVHEATGPFQGLLGRQHQLLKIVHHVVVPTQLLGHVHARRRTRITQLMSGIGVQQQNVALNLITGLKEKLQVTLAIEPLSDRESMNPSISGNNNFLFETIRTEIQDRLWAVLVTSSVTPSESIAVEIYIELHKLVDLAHGSSSKKVIRLPSTSQTELEDGTFHKGNHAWKWLACSRLHCPSWPTSSSSMALGERPGALEKSASRLRSAPGLQAATGSGHFPPALSWMGHPLATHHPSAQGPAM